jgi:hypothetical protein
VVRRAACRPSIEVAECTRPLGLGQGEEAAPGYSAAQWGAACRSTMKMFKQLAGYPRAKGRSLSVFRPEAIEFADLAATHFG